VTDSAVWSRAWSYVLEERSRGNPCGIVMCADGPVPPIRKPPEDITQRSQQMPRDSCILYRNQDPRGDDPSHYRGVMKDADGQTFWVGLWVRTCKGRRVLEIKRTPKKN
jgi:hypothetical protein